LKNNTLLKEKAESIRHWETIVGLAKKIDWHDSMVKDFAVITSEYGLRLFKILECVFNLVVAEQRKDMYAAGIWLHKYDETLEKYNTLTADKNCPTLFKTNVTKRMECEAASSLVSRLEKSVQDRNRNSIK